MSDVNRKQTEVVGSEKALLLRGNEVALRLGVSRAMAYKMIQNGTLPVVRIGRAVRVPAHGLSRWVSENTEGGRRE